jgi:predicted nucleotidyltransferase
MQDGYMGVQLRSGQEIAGFPALKIRDLLRKIGDGSIREEWLLDKGFHPQEASQLFEALVQHLYIEPNRNIHERDGRYYKLTEQGLSIARASGAKRVQRETAARALTDFMVRVREVNENPKFLMMVTEVVIFGSYLSDKENLGDLDIACKCEFKFAFPDPQTFAKKLSEHFKASGRSSKGSLVDMYWPWEQVHLYLKNRKRTISLHGMEQVEMMIKKSGDFRFEVMLGDREVIINRSK